jgi:hypothetical protein
MKLCHICRLKQTKTDSILDFPFKIYETRHDLSIALLENIKKDKNYIFTIDPEYNSNIVHDIVYYLARNTFIHRQYRKQHIWALEILSNQYGFRQLCNKRNDNGEVPLDAFIRKCEDRNSRMYEYVKNILSSYTDQPVTILEPKKVIIDPFVAELTNKYHNFQKKLFKYFEDNYNSKITRCEVCREIIDIFDDLESIGKELKNDSFRELISLNLKHIIIMRNKCIELCEDNKVNQRHKHIITYFDKLLEDVENLEGN